MPAGSGSTYTMSANTTLTSGDITSADSLSLNVTATIDITLGDAIEGVNFIPLFNVGTNTGTIKKPDTTTLRSLPSLYYCHIFSYIDSSGVPQWGATPARPISTSLYTVTNGTTDRTYDADASSVNELADVLYSLLKDLGYA